MVHFTYMEQYAIQLAQLKAELAVITDQLTPIAILDRETGDWSVRTADIDHTETDENNKADASEEVDERLSVLTELENRYRLILHALKKFELGTYGICEVSGEIIEGKRLTINPAARTCTHHMENEQGLPRP